MSLFIISNNIGRERIKEISKINESEYIIILLPILTHVMHFWNPIMFLSAVIAHVKSYVEHDYDVLNL